MNKKLNYVVSKTPLRVSFLGGGTDIPYFYKKYGGSTFSVAINKFVYVTLKRHSTYYIEKYRLNYYESENCNNLNQIKNSIIRETLKYFKINFPLYISVISDVPAGSGLGGSSSFIVGLINAICKLQGITKSKKQLYEIATQIEINIIKSPIGKQDHVPAVYGGMLYTKYLKNDKVVVKKIKEQKFLSDIKILWTKQTRTASFVLRDQKKNYKKNISSLLKIKKIADLFCQHLEKKKSNTFKFLINSVQKSWEVKKKLTILISNKKINKLINFANKYGIGAKLLGAGGGGFVLLLDRKKKLNHFFDFKVENIKICNEGSQIILEN